MRFDMSRAVRAKTGWVYILAILRISLIHLEAPTLVWISEGVFPRRGHRSSYYEIGA